MNWRESFISEIESKTNEHVCWQANLSFFADNQGNTMEGDVVICQCGYSFFIGNETARASFFAPDLNFKGLSKKKDALDYLSGKIDRVKNVSLFFSLFAESLNSYEFEGGYVCFLKTKGNQLNQLIDIAISKQKYSLSEFNRLHNN